MSDIEKIRLDGGRLCLDFINTVHDRREEPQSDYLHNFFDLLEWSNRTRVVGAKSHEIMRSEYEGNEMKTSSFFAEMLDFRELLYAIFLKVARNEQVDPKDLKRFNRIASSALSKLKIEQNLFLFEEQWNVEPVELEYIWLLIVKDAYDLLLMNKPVRLRECPKCGWLFYDSSKNGRRKWCSMETCGSQVKAINWYHRNKE